MSQQTIIDYWLEKAGQISHRQENFSAGRHANAVRMHILRASCIVFSAFKSGNHSVDIASSCALHRILSAGEIDQSGESISIALR